MLSKVDVPVALVDRAVPCPPTDGLVDGCDLLPAPDIVAGVPVIRLHVFAFAVLDVGMQQNDDVAPALAAIARQ